MKKEVTRVLSEAVFLGYRIFVLAIVVFIYSLVYLQTVSFMTYLFAIETEHVMLITVGVLSCGIVKLTYCCLDDWVRESIYKFVHK